MRVLWWDGELRDPGEPVVNAFDRGFTVGDGIFETIAVHDGQPFALSRHLGRLERSAAGMHLPAPPRAIIQAAVAEVGAALPVGPARLRITWTAGVGPSGSARGDGPGSLVITAETHRPATTAPRLVTSPWPRHERSPLHQVKSISYAENVLALHHAQSRGGTEAILLNSRGELSEGSASNVFVEIDGAVLTPPLGSGCLAGITRELVLEWGRHAGFPIREQVVSADVLRASDHVAISSSLRGLLPAASLDDRILVPGPLTTALSEIFATRRAESPDP